MSLKTDYAYIRMTAAPQLGRKTERWGVQNMRSGSYIGMIEWYTPWRQFCFFALPETVYSAGCLADVQDFIRQVMEERKNHA